MSSAGQKCNHFRARNKPKLLFFNFFIVQIAKKFWRPRKYTTAFRFGTYPALLIANVAWRLCMLFPLLFRNVTAWSLESDSVIGFPKSYSLFLNSAIKLKFRRCSALLLKASDRFRCCLRIDWKSFYSIPLWYLIPLNYPKKIEKTGYFFFMIYLLK